ncbi:amino acid adenylation domain-containing protein, partial [bacterium]|nr:amino acid adenylation domain-containing protein [bacterium]
KDDFIGICMEKSPITIAAMLAVLKNGSAFIPLDPGQPAKRLEYMIQDARLKKILVTAETIDFVKNISRDNLAQDLVTIDVSRLPLAPILGKSGTMPDYAPNYTPENPAYVIYTSGSTGRPKGVIVPHRGLLNFMHWLTNTFSISANDRISQFSSLSFDASIAEIWPTLGSGACLNLVPNDLMFDPLELRDWIIANKITIHFCSTALTEILLQLEWSRSCRLRILYTGGDTLRVSPAEGLPFITYNMYGPTENSVVSTSAEISAAGNLSPEIGKPLDNVNCHLLRQNEDFLTPVPPGAPGELYLDGNGLATGYLNDSERTATSFSYWSPTTFRTGQELSDTIRIYKTGDLVRYRSDGKLEFIGRVDNQVKIRGFRIELGEIENALKQHTDIFDAIVITHGNAADNKHLLAFVVKREGKTTSANELSVHLQTILPTYMLPTEIIAVKIFPMMPSGKIDRKALANSLLKQVPNNIDAAAKFSLETQPIKSRATTRKVAFMFAGQGSVPVIDQELLNEPIFKENIDLCAEILKSYLKFDILEVLHSGVNVFAKTSGQAPLTTSTQINQPALFVFEYALAKLWIKRGITPSCMIGHSIGEWVAATISGVFSLEDSLQLVTYRGEIMGKQAPGKMLAVPLAETEALRYLETGLSLATVNTPEQSVISGTEKKIDELRKLLELQNIHATKLNTSHAFHSEMMIPAMAEMEKAVAKVKRCPPKIPFISNISGDWITDMQATSPIYWSRHLRETVRFGDGLNTLLRDHDLCLLEIGPNRILTNMVLRAPTYAKHLALPSLDPISGKSNLMHLAETAATLGKAGCSLDLAAGVPSAKAGSTFSYDNPISQS